MNVNLAGLASLVPNNVSLPSLPSVSVPSVSIPVETGSSSDSSSGTSLSTVTPTPVPTSESFEMDEGIRMKARQVSVSAFVCN